MKTRRGPQKAPTRTLPPPRTDPATTTARIGRGFTPPPALAPDPGWKAVRRSYALSGRAAALGLWVLVLSGPLLGIAALGAPRSAGTTQVAAPAADTAGPSGIAQLYLEAYLAAGSGTEASVRVYLPSFPSVNYAPGGRAAESVAVLSCKQSATGVFTVVLAAHVLDYTGTSWADAGVHYYQIPIAVASGSATGYLALALPAEVAAPGQLAAGPATVYTNTDAPTSGTSLSDAVSHFLEAYLTGTGEVSRYTAAGSALSAIDPAPYSSVLMTNLATNAAMGSDVNESVPPAGTVRQVMATVQATDPAGNQWNLSYALTLAVTGGQWEVTALSGAPALAGSVPGALLAPPMPTNPATPGPTPSPTGSVVIPDPTLTGLNSSSTTSY